MSTNLKKLKNIIEGVTVDKEEERAPEEVKSDQLKKLALFSEDPDLAIFDELQEINDILRKRYAILTKRPDFPDYPEPDFTETNDRLDELIGTIRGQEDVDMSGIEKLLSQIASKEDKEVDLSELASVTNILDDVLLAVQGIKIKDDTDTVTALGEVKELLSSLNESIKTQQTEIDYDKLGKVFKANTSYKGGAVGPSKKFVQNASGTVVNPSTEEKQDEILTDLDKLIGFEVPSYDEIDLTYVAAGNGVGELETVTYSKSSSPVFQLTLTYNSDNEISKVANTT